LSENGIIKQIETSLKSSATPAAKASFSRFFKEKVTGYGVKTPIVNRLAKEYYRKIKTLPKKEIFSLCDRLMESGMIEEKFIAAEWAEEQAKNLIGSDFVILEKWVKNCITNWAECDTLCNHAVGSFITRFPQYISELKKWAKSKNRWVKRASCVSLILPARRGEFLPDVFELSDMLRDDPDDMVQKGYGWMLKEASRKHTKEVFNYVMKYKKTMPRTAFRYAIEKMPDELKKKAMAKGNKI
jgi:3-methyladenine DNA glycosylase AlkD